MSRLIPAPDNFMNVTIDDKHHYHVDGKPYPGFTEIASAVGAIPHNSFYTDAGREEGTAIHSWMIFLARGETPKEAPDPRIAGRVEGFKKFLAESRFTLTDGEKPLCEPTLRYCGTPDLWGSISGVTGCVIDVKSGAREPWHNLQTASYKVLLAANQFRASDRFALYLSDGDYRLVRHTDAGDENRWRAIVAAYYAARYYNGGKDAD